MNKRHLRRLYREASKNIFDVRNNMCQVKRKNIRTKQKERRFKKCPEIKSIKNLQILQFGSTAKNLCAYSFNLVVLQISVNVPRAIKCNGKCFFNNYTVISSDKERTRIL